jgi:hypothetical protein
LRHRATLKFWTLYEALPIEARRLADKNYELLKADPKHPSLHFKNVKGELWSVRVGMGFRALALPSEDGLGVDWHACRVQQVEPIM